MWSEPWLIGLGLVEVMCSISGEPSLNAEVSHLAEPGQQARTQGVFQTVQFAIQIVGALVGGALFTISPTWAFLAITVVCILGISSAILPALMKLFRLNSARHHGAASHTTPPPGSLNRR